MEKILQKNFNGAIQMMRLDRESRTVRHTHAFLEFVYIANGSAAHHIGGVSGQLQTGNYFVVDYNTAHDYCSEKNDLTVINCLFLPEIIDQTFAGVQSFNDLAERYFFRIMGRKINGPTSNQIFLDDGTVGRLFERMLEEYERQQDGYTEMLRCMLCEIIIQTIRRIGSDTAVSPLTAFIIEEIQKNYMRHISLETICRQVHYSLPYVSGKFKEETGITFTAYLQNKRIEESCRLLAESSAGIAEVSERVGYTSVKFFNRVFRQVTKMTPREYRKQRT